MNKPRLQNCTTVRQTDEEKEALDRNSRTLGISIPILRPPQNQKQKNPNSKISNLLQK